MLNLLKLNVKMNPEVNNPYLPWELCWYPATVIYPEWKDAFDWFVRKNMSRSQTRPLDKKEVLSNGNKLYSQNLDTRPY